MGFFSSRSRPEVPKPSVVVCLERPQETVYRPNDTISGHVEIITTATPFTAGQVVVSFWGESKVWIRTSSSTTNSSTGTNSTDYYHYRDNVQLFNITLNLLPEFVQVHPNQPQRYPFSFQMPKGTNVDRTGCYKDPKEKHWSALPNIWTTLPHSLPPSFSHGGASYNTCSIQYGVTAQLKHDEGGGRGFSSAVGHSDDSHLSSCTAPIFFAPHTSKIDISNQSLDQSLTRTSKQFNLSSSSLSGHDPQMIGFRQRIKDRLSSATPHLRFELGVEFPNVLKAGHEFRFRCTFDVLGGEKVVSIPPVTFKVLKLALLDLTFFRAPRDWSAANTMAGSPSRFARSSGVFRADDQRISREDRLPLNAVPDSQTAALDERVAESGEEQKITEQEEHCEVWFSGRVPGFTCPTFRSFAINLAHHLHAKIRVEFGGKEFDIEAESPTIYVGSG